MMLSVLVVVFALLPSSSLRGNCVEAAATDYARAEMRNVLTGVKQCSHGEKEWHICLGDWRPLMHCPSVLEFDSSQLINGPCFTCPDGEDACESAVNAFLEINKISEEANYDDDIGYNIADKLLASCQQLCEAGKKGDTCWSNSYKNHWDTYHDSCAPGSYFCDFSSDKDFAMNISGTCKACPVDKVDCYQDGFVTSSEGKRNCVACTLNCFQEGKSILTVNGKDIPTSLVQTANQKWYQNASGSLIDCSNLLLEGKDVCPGAEGQFCVLDWSILVGSEVAQREWILVDAAEQNGCVAVIIIPNEGFNWNVVKEIAIPCISVEDVTTAVRKQLRYNEHDVVAQLEVQVFGSSCNSDIVDCNIEVPCGESEFCKYYNMEVDGVATEGYCIPCPAFENGEPDPAGCFFDRYQDDSYSNYSPEVVKSCAKSCNATLVSDQCKFCPSEVSAFDFGVDDKADQCYFCPNKDVQYPQKIVPLFGKNVTCWMIQTFFNRMEVHKDSQNCRLAQSMNYMCGCNGTGYAGANTYTKQVLLVWLPRVSAILSMAGSLTIIFDTLRTRRKRAKLMNQLLSTLSLFDIMGSISYSLTTLPTPASDELFGAKGNAQTCITQGFFIQIGTTACFLNVSLAFYYLLTIKYGLTEERLKRDRAGYFLFIPPIAVGLVYAFAGIPHYDNVRVWCNNAAKWWPEVPVILAIIAATGIMGNLCYNVYKVEQRTIQYTNSGARHSLSLFKQSCWFVFAFYITWIPYLALQYMLSSGAGYDNYGLICSASTLVPLQGFWNNFVYIRPRYLSNILGHFGSSIHRVSSAFKRITKPSSTVQSASEFLQQSGERDQLQIVQVGESAVMNTLDEEGDKANTPNKNKLDSKTLEMAPKEKLGLKLDEEVRRCITVISDQNGNGAYFSEDDSDSERLSRMSDNESGDDKPEQKQQTTN